jgi:hypothetical protein
MTLHASYHPSNSSPQTLDLMPLLSSRNAPKRFSSPPLLSNLSSEE